MARRPLSSTDCVHAGAGPCETDGAVTVPVVHSAPFAFETTQALVDFLEGRSERRQPEYGRMANPTVTAVERRLAALEGAEQARLFASGMAAACTVLLAFLRSGDHLVLTDDGYKRTRDFAVEHLGGLGVRSSVVPADVDSIRAALEPQTRLVFTEVPTNPRLSVVDVEALAALGRERGFLTVVDSTFATPVNLRPLELGADLVVHSATKYLGGHNDLIAGVVAGPAERLQPVSDLLMTLGAICDPQTAFLLDRGLKTLALRVERQNANGQAVAEFLAGHPRVAEVLYPGLPSHPHHAIARRLMRGFGGVVTFRLDGDFTAAARFVDALELARLAPSLGGVETLVEQVALMGYWQMPPAERERLGVGEELVRLSLGIEEADDIIADLSQALDGM